MSKVNAKIKTQDEFLEGLNEYARLRVRQMGVEAEQAAEKQAMMARHAAEWGPLEKARKSLKAVLATFAKNMRDRLLPDGRKSVNFALGIFGYETTPEKLVNITKFKEAELAEKLYKLEGLDECVTVSYSLNKEAIKRLLKGDSMAAQTLAHYFERETSEQFIVYANAELKGEK